MDIGWMKGNMCKDELDAIQKWYYAQCDGDWEHSWGLKIDTLDNPGWKVEINLEGTSCEDVPFAHQSKNVGPGAIEKEIDWYDCKIENNIFKGACGPFHLRTILRIFLDWQKKQGRK